MTSLASQWMKKSANVSRISNISVSNALESKNKGGSVSSVSNISISNPTELEIVQPAQVESLVASSFDSNHWRKQIETALNSAINLDQGALEYCSLHNPELHAEYMAAANQLDTVYISRDGQNMLIAIQGHNNAFKAVRDAMCESLRVKRGVVDVKN